MGAPSGWEPRGDAQWWDPAMRQHVPPGPPPERPHYPGHPPPWQGGKGKGPPGPPHGYMPYPPPLPPWRQHPPPGKGGKKGDFGHGPPEDPYEGGATIAPPSNFREPNRTGTDANTGKEYKLLMADGLVVNNVPPELLSMAPLHRHFRRFGEIMKLTIHDAEGRAFVQYAEQPAAEAAKQEVVLDCPDIEVSWVKRKTKGGAKGRLKEKGQMAPDGSYMPRVLISDPEERKKFESATQKRGEVELKKRELLQQYTKQLQTVLAKLQEPGLSEEKRESYNAILVKIKEKMNSVNKMAVEAPPPPKVEEAPAPSMPTGPVRYTLDLRTKAIRVVKESTWTSEKKAKEETVNRLGPGNGVKYVQWEPSSEKHAIVTFANRWYAEQAYERRAEIGMFDMEWCENPPPPPPRPVPESFTGGDQMAEEDGEAENNGPASGLPSELLRADEDGALPAAMEEVEAAENAAAATAADAPPDAEVGTAPAADANQQSQVEDGQDLEGEAKALKEAMEKAEAEEAMTAVDLNDDEQ
eukprot:gnl/MRDRNA2_/MRDRNA2_117533_c0_seq1.p1 gnl/MRDRNA2_/MRDRNA2_117533_c0~~gnl/MRDRNA2_/MRDRNA2_117533_c0_seq1.p1  ORF type:complete len:600 (-),score=159.12 gnl/MRDRNA2_/MRDRNA2_117533_c0_seq1:41-1615(-)